jgi:hypothetical protein
VLPDLPVACYGISAVELENSLYALGDTNSVQKLSLVSLTWELMWLKLPQAARCIAFFKTDSQVYLVIKKTLYSFTPKQIKPIKTLPRGIECYTSYYSRGTVYYDTDRGIKSLTVGELTSP